MVTNSSDPVGWMATVASKSALVAPILIATAILKIFNSYLLTGNSALSMLKPAVTGLIICMIAVFVLKKKN